MGALGVDISTMPGLTSNKKDISRRKFCTYSSLGVRHMQNKSILASWSFEEEA